MSTAVTTYQSQSLTVQPSVPWQDINGMVQFAKAAHEAQGIVPKHITSWQAALMIMQAGVEYRIGPIQALSSIYMVSGRITLSAKLQHGLVSATYGPEALQVVETTPDKCVVEYRVGGKAQPRTYEFTMEMAQRAGLVQKGGPWVQYPEAMLRARAISAVIGFAFPEVCAGLITPEEIDAPVRVTSTGDVVLDVEKLPQGPIQEPRPIRQTNTDTGEITILHPAATATVPVAEEDLPAPSAWIVALRGLVEQLAQFGVHEELPATLTRGQARVIKAALINTLAEAKQQAEESPL